MDAEFAQMKSSTVGLFISLQSNCSPAYLHTESHSEIMMPFSYFQTQGRKLLPKCAVM